MVIEPGDLIVGDEDGFLSVPFDDAERIYRLAVQKRDKEAAILADTLAGKLDPKLWVEEELKRLGCSEA